MSRTRIWTDLKDGPHNPQTDGTAKMQAIARSAARTPSVAIVGAGMSGLRCADVLIRSGAQVTVLEARSRIGGRVHQASSSGHLIDMGPNWIHGTSKANPIMRLAEKTSGLVYEPEENSAVFGSDGKQRTAHQASHLTNMIWGMVVKAFKYSDSCSASIDRWTSLMDFYREQLTKEVKDPEQLHDLLKEAQMWGPFVGDPIEKQSLKFFFLEECIDGENAFLASTYKNILAEVGKTALERSAIEFQKEVKLIELGSHGHGVTIATKDGRRQTYDEVVLTCPLGWLKRNKQTSFVPKLPTRLSQAIDNINYGRLEKLHITFPSAWWLKSSDTSIYPCFTHFHDPEYIEHDSGVPSNQSVMSLAHLPGPTAHPTLLFYMYGPCATNVVASLANLEPHSEAYSTVLDVFAKPFYTRIPGYTSTNSECVPSSFLCTTWQSDAFAGNGSYCNFQVGLEKGDEDIECMRNAGGLWEDGLWLAGEHTAPFIALGTTTGAYWSGEGVARRICRKWDIRVEEDDMAKEVQTVTENGEVSDGKKDLGESRADGANVGGLAI